MQRIALRHGAMLVQAHKLGKRYSGVWAVRDIDLTLVPGDALLLTGHNGSGKSTLIQLLSALSRPTAGKIEWFGKKAPDRQRIGLVSHHSHHYEELTGRENLELTARALRRSATEVTETIAQIGLTERAENRVRVYSAGMRKRLAIGRILLKRPSLVLLDEPFGELDPAGSDWLELVISQFRQDGAAVVLATHLVEQGQRLCQRRLHLEQGIAKDEVTP